MPERDYAGMVDLAREAEQERLAVRRQQADLLAGLPGMPSWGQNKGQFIDTLAGGVEYVSELPQLGAEMGRRAMEGDPSYSPKPAFDIMNLMITGNLPAAIARGGASAGIFGGRLSAGADRAALRRAEQLTAQGADPRDVYQRTGWYRGADGEWRFEISDAKASWKPPGILGTLVNPWHYGVPHEQLPRLGEYFKHAELEKAYPGILNDIRVGLLPKAMQRESKAAFDPESRTVYVNPRVDPKQTKSSLLHELQHYIQEREGFSTGSNLGEPQVKALAEKAAPGFRRRAQEHLDQVTRQAYDYVQERRAAGDTRDMFDIAKDFWNFNPSMRNDYDIARKMVQDPNVTMREALFRSYLRQAGEAEARNVQTRAAMSKRDRMLNYPESTADYPFSEQMAIPHPQPVLPF